MNRGFVTETRVTLLTSEASLTARLELAFAQLDRTMLVVDSDMIAEVVRPRPRLRDLDLTAFADIAAWSSPLVVDRGDEKTWWDLPRRMHEPRAPPREVLRRGRGAVRVRHQPVSFRRPSTWRSRWISARG